MFESFRYETKYLPPLHMLSNPSSRNSSLSFSYFHLFTNSLSQLSGYPRRERYSADNLWELSVWSHLHDFFLLDISSKDQKDVIEPIGFNWQLTRAARAEYPLVPRVRKTTA